MNDNAYHYHVVRRAIDWIEHNHAQNPSLGDVAAAVGLSPAHFQRIFSAWVGVSPTRYQQYLSLNLARELLRNRFTVLDTAHLAGLSGPSRLHDLFLRWEAMTPGAYAAKGKGLVIREGWFDGPFGEMLVMATDKGICGIALASETGRDRAVADMRGRWPRAEFVHDPKHMQRWVENALQGAGKTHLHLIGSPFQIKVWEALLAIPEGSVTTYGEIARHIGKPAAIRAVGTAVGRNPVGWLIPCHRVLRRSGALGGYHWGLPIKRALLAREAARADSGEGASRVS